MLGSICIWGRKPFECCDEDGHWTDTVEPQEEYNLARDFRRDYKFTPRKGSCRQYELSLKEIE
jgi:hypothetical protein